MSLRKRREGGEKSFKQPIDDVLPSNSYTPQASEDPTSIETIDPPPPFYNRGAHVMWGAFAGVVQEISGGSLALVKGIRNDLNDWVPQSDLTPRDPLRPAPPLVALPDALQAAAHAPSPPLRPSLRERLIEGSARRTPYQPPTVERAFTRDQIARRLFETDPRIIVLVEWRAEIRPQDFIVSLTNPTTPDEAAVEAASLRRAETLKRAWEISGGDKGPIHIGDRIENVVRRECEERATAMTGQAVGSALRAGHWSDKCERK